MNIIFFIKSASVDISNYTIKDIPGTTGRFDVILRCVLAALLDDNEFEKNIQIWIFLDKYGTFVFDSELMDYDNFPKNQLLLSKCFVHLIRKDNSKFDLNENPLRSIKRSKLSLVEALNQYKELGYAMFVLEEKGDDFFKHVANIRLKKNVIFVIGNQSGEFLNSEDLLRLQVPVLSLGTRSYLASSIIRLIKIMLLKSI